ncbi:hypothetical protein Tco_1037837 [Tanacetum coccineum]
MVSASKDPLIFNDLIATPTDFSKYVLNGLKIENLTQDILLGLAFHLLKGTCFSSIELDYNFQECLNAFTDKLDWNNPEGDCLLGMRQRNKEMVPNNFGVPSCMRMTKMSQGNKAWVKGVNCGTDLRSDFVDLHLNKIEDMLLLVVQHKLFHLDGSDIVDFIVALHMFTRSLILKRRVEDLQLGVESYHKKLNITKPQKTFTEIEFKEPYTPSYDPPGIVYEDLDKQKRVLRADELYKFSDGTLKSVRDEIHHRVVDFRLDYNTEMPKRKWMAVDRKRSGLMIELVDKQLREREIIRNMKRLVGATKLEMDYKLITRTV